MMMLLLIAVVSLVVAWLYARLVGHPYSGGDSGAAVYDYVVVGAGSAGCVVASRLSEDANTTVLLIEAGGPDSSPVIKIPAASNKLQRGDMDWQFKTEPQQYSHSGYVNRVSNWPRGKVMGGSSSINYMVYVRGHRDDYDTWAHKLGCAGWSWRDVLPYFKKSEDQMSTRPEFAPDRNPNHARGGLLHVTDQPDIHPLTSIWLRACQAVGHKLRVDYNDGDQIGCAPCQVTQFKSERWNTARAFIRPFLTGSKKRSNLHVMTNAHVAKVLFNDDKEAIGVEVLQNGKSIIKQARREVVLSCGAVGSPHLLMLSGVGPREHLEEHGVEVVFDSPGVGENLQDHMMIGVGHEAKIESLGEHSVSAGNLIKYLTKGTGPFASNGLEGTMFYQTGVRKDLGNAPDMQIHFVAAPATAQDQANIGFLPKYQRSFKYGFHSIPVLLHPRSRGTIRLRDARPTSAPIIQPNYLKDPTDVVSMREGLKMAYKINTAAPFDEVRGGVMGKEAWADNPHEPFTDEWWEFQARQFSATVYHPVGTCRMGPVGDERRAFEREQKDVDHDAHDGDYCDENMIVVDSRLRVRGVKRLRVVDCSIMPTLVSGNTNAPAIMVGEKGADLIIADHLVTKPRRVD